MDASFSRIGLYPTPGTGPRPIAVPIERGMVFVVAMEGPKDHLSIEERARAALDARLARLGQNPATLKSNRSLQPTPEATKSRVNRLRRMKRILTKNSKRASAKS